MFFRENQMAAPRDCACPINRDDASSGGQHQGWGQRLKHQRGASGGSYREFVFAAAYTQPGDYGVLALSPAGNAKK
jgi:hypothetical protein